MDIAPASNATFTTPDGRSFQVGPPSYLGRLPEPRPGSAPRHDLAGAGIAPDAELARITSIQQDGSAWQTWGGPKFDEAIPLAGSFRDAVGAAAKLSARLRIGFGMYEPTFAVVAGANDARYAVELRGVLKNSKVLGESDITEVFASGARPEVEAIVSRSRWIDLRGATADSVHGARRLTQLPLIGPLV
jgi:hypothetical protein